MTAIPLTATRCAQPASARGVRTVVTACLFVAAILPRVGFLARPFESDSGLYIYMGKALVEGQTLYRDVYETKPPGVALFTASLYTAFGEHWWMYVALQAVMVVVAARLLGRAMAHHAGAHAGRGTFWFALVYLNFGLAAYRGFQLETVQAFFASVAGYFALRWMRDERPTVGACLSVGLFAGIAAMLKPTGAAVAGAAVVALMVSRRWRSGILIGMGLLVAPFAVAAWTWRAGLVSEMPALLREIALYGRETPLVALDWAKPVMILLLVGFPFFATRAFRDGSERGPQAIRLNGIVLFAMTWLVLEGVGVFVQRRMYAYHFLVLAPPLAVLFGCVCRESRLRALVAAFGPVLALSLAGNAADFRALWTGVGPLAGSEYLLAHAAPTDRVVGDGIERLLMETRLRCGARYLHLFYFANHDTAPLEYGRRFLEDLEQNRPEWAVFDTRREEDHRRQCEDLPMLSERPVRRENFLSAWREIDAYVARHYRPVATLNGKTIYRWVGEIRIISSSSRPSSYPRRAGY